MLATGRASSEIAFRGAFNKLGLSFVAACSLFAGSGLIAAQARAPQPTDVVAIAALPTEAQTTYRLIHAGGPFPYAKDGVIFGNRERLLPAKSRGHYREYTVKTPGSRNRGARRIVCGGEPPSKPQVCFYTADHYASFTRIAQ